MSDPPSAPAAGALNAPLQAAAARIVETLRAAERDVEVQLHALATRESAEYVSRHMLTARPIRQRKHPEAGRFDLLEYALDLVTIEGLYAEFGVFKGDTLVFIADRIDTVVYGFDSFRGLPEDWFLNYGRGYFDLGGRAPELTCTQRNTRLVPGPFAEALPIFIREIEGPMAFVHIDCGLYSAARTALFGLAGRIVPGTVILFGSYLNYPGWREHEFRAFQVFAQAHGVRYRYAAFAPAMFSAAVVIEAV
jgi:hypothetical protein